MSKLFIIGNGFDIHHGIPSRYTDFADWLEGEDREVFDAFEEFIPSSFDASGVERAGWADLENNLANFDVQQLLDYGDNFLPSYGAEDWSESGHHDHEHELDEKTSLVSSRLHRCFVRWLRTLDSASATRFPVSAVDRRGKFLNFNYTPTLQRVYGATDVLHIHGSLLDDVEDIVLGHGWDPAKHKQWASHIDESTDTRVASGYHLIDKYFRKTFKPTSKIIARNWQFFCSLGSVTEVFVLGHGLADVDRPYFEQILLGVPKSARWTISYYGDSSDWMTQSAGEIGIPMDRAAFHTLASL